MNPILFALPGNQEFAAQLSATLKYEKGDIQTRKFPDGETYLRLLTSVAGRDVIFLCTLNQPDEKLMSLYLAGSIARELGAKSVGFVIPYLAYMRQDACFNEGEGITSRHFARLISSCCDWLVTVDPHLHRHRGLPDLYTARTRVVQAAPEISKWIMNNIRRPFILGPDSESRQWVAETAQMAGCPYEVLQKVRTGDRSLQMSPPNLAGLGDRTLVLLDDIASTAHTLLVAGSQCLALGANAPVCIVVHPLFAGDAYDSLHSAGLSRIVSCNTVPHPSNEINISEPVATAIKEML